jgi:hypothetical protein
VEKEVLIKQAVVDQHSTDPADHIMPLLGYGINQNINIMKKIFSNTRGV